MRKIILPILLLWLVTGCAATPTPAPDLVATQVAVMEAAAATLTAGAPTSVPAATFTPTSVPTTGPATPLPTPSALPTATPAPVATVTASPPPTGPSLGRFAVVDIHSDDVLNVRAGPGISYGTVGTVPYNGTDVNVLVGGQQVGESWWVPVEYDGVSGWVNSAFLARQVGNASGLVAAPAARAIMALKDGDLDELSRLVHPDKGVRFSPYATVQTGADGDLVFSAGEVRSLLTDPTVYHWGVYDGSGLSIDLTFGQYYEEFVYDVGFARPDVVGFNERVGQGSSIDNIANAYPNGMMVEYHFEGFDAEYAGMDWRSLRLVFEEKDGTWYLVGIVHDQWTI